MTQRERTRVRAALIRLQAMIDPSPKGYRCTLPPEIKLTIAPYLSTWVVPHLQVALGEVARNTPEDVGETDAEEVVRRFDRERPIGAPEVEVPADA